MIAKCRTCAQYTSHHVFWFECPRLSFQIQYSHFSSPGSVIVIIRWSAENWTWIFPIKCAIYRCHHILSVEAFTQYSAFMAVFCELLNIIFHLQDGTCLLPLMVVTPYLLPFTTCRRPSLSYPSLSGTFWFNDAVIRKSHWAVGDGCY